MLSEFHNLIARFDTTSMTLIYIYSSDSKRISAADSRVFGFSELLTYSWIILISCSELTKTK